MHGPFLAGQLSPGVLLELPSSLVWGTDPGAACHRPDEPDPPGPSLARRWAVALALQIQKPWEGIHLPASLLPKGQVPPPVTTSHPRAAT